MRKKLVSTFLTSILVSWGAAEAATTYTDRASFETALGAFVVDDLDDVPHGRYWNTTVDRGDYSLSGAWNYQPWAYGCVVSAECGLNETPVGFAYPGYLWHYEPNPTIFTFDAPVKGLGFDFQFYYPSPTEMTLNGVESLASSGFFGVIFDSAQTEITLYNNSSSLLTDNHTYGALEIAPVPLPAAAWFFLTALFGAGWFRRRQKRAEAIA